MAPGGTSYQFSVVYYDDAAINVTTLAGGNVLVTGPNGFSTTGTLIGVDANTNGSPRIATYSIIPPGGIWTPATIGNYTVSIRPNQVFNTAGSAAPAAVLGTFRVVTPLQLTVTTLADSGPGSLRDAITQANAMQPTADTITFDPALFAGGPGITSLLSALPTISDSLTITGPAIVNGQPRLTIQRGAAAAFGIFDINGPGVLAVNLSNMTIAGGTTAGSGGGIQDADEALTLTNVVVSGNSAAQNGGGISTVGGPLVLSNCTVANNVAQVGGGLSVSGQLSVSGSTIRANVATGLGGGGILVGGSVANLVNSSVTGNFVNASQTSLVEGGGIQSVSANLTLTNCTVTGNTVGAFQGNRVYGGGIFVGASDGLVMSGCTISANKVSSGSNFASTVAGGGIFGYRSARLSLSNCTVTGNSAVSQIPNAVYGGGIGAWTGSVAVVGCTISGNTTNGSGGGIGLKTGGTLALSSSTVSGNSAGSTGGGVYFQGLVGTAGVVLQNATIAGNTAASGGGAGLTSLNGTLLVQNSTISANSATTTNSAAGQGGGGIALTSASTASGAAAAVVLQSTIVAGNMAANFVPDVATASGANVTVSADHSLIGVADVGFTLSPTSANNLTGTVAAPLDAKLAPLGNYGGPTQTMAESVGSPALDAGSNPAGLATDQRGVARAIGVGPDIGAYEYQPITVAALQVNDGSAQRSEVRSITVTFSGPVSFANGNAAAAFQLQHVQDSTNVNNLSAAVSSNAAGQTVVTLTFTTAGNAAAEIDPVSARNGQAASLADGRFRLTVLGSAVSDAALGWAGRRRRRQPRRQLRQPVGLGRRQRAAPLPPLRRRQRRRHGRRRRFRPGAVGLRLRCRRRELPGVPRRRRRRHDQRPRLRTVPPPLRLQHLLSGPPATRGARRARPPHHPHDRQFFPMPLRPPSV